MEAGATALAPIGSSPHLHTPAAIQLGGQSTEGASDGGGGEAVAGI